MHIEIAQTIRNALKRISIVFLALTLASCVTPIKPRGDGALAEFLEPLIR